MEKGNKKEIKRKETEFEEDRPTLRRRGILKLIEARAFGDLILSKKRIPH